LFDWKQRPANITSRRVSNESDRKGSQKQPEEWSQNWLPIIVATENICEEQLSYCAVLSMALDFKAVHFEK